MIDLSVIIPTYNRAHLLRTCLEALAQQTYPPARFEVIVVVDGSTDDTLRVLRQLSLPYHLVVDEQPNGGAARARNRGAMLASGQVCLFLDDDMLAEPTLVAEHLRAQCESDTPLVGLGQMTYRLPAQADGFARQVSRWWQAHYARLGAGTVRPSPLDCWSGNLAVPRALFLEVGGFDAAAAHSHDVELGYRLADRGARLVYLPAAVAHQQQTKSFSGIARDAQQAGLENVWLWRRYPPLLTTLGLGRFGQAHRRFRLARRALLALNPSFGLLQLASLVLGRGRLANCWYGLIFDYCYWRGVRAGLADDPPQWHRLTHSP